MLCGDAFEWDQCFYIKGQLNFVTVCLLSVGERGIVTCRYLHLAKEEMSEFRQLDG